MVERYNDLKKGLYKRKKDAFNQNVTFPSILYAKIPNIFLGNVKHSRAMSKTCFNPTNQAPE